jgi:hypothetical protein
MESELGSIKKAPAFYIMGVRVAQSLKRNRGLMFQTALKNKGLA